MIIVLIFLIPILLVIAIGLVIGAYWEWQTAKSKGNTSRGFLDYHTSGEASGFSLKKENTFEGMLVRLTPRFFITPRIIVINILIFTLTALSDVTMHSPKTDQLISWGANFGPLTVNGQWWRLLFSTFLHAGPLHLIVNMWFLWKLGNYAERIYGNWNFLMLYILSGIGGGIVSLLLHPTVVSVGASGAILGVAGGLIAVVYLEGLNYTRKFKNSELIGIIVFLGYSLFGGLWQSGIDTAAHLGGLFVGLLITFFLYAPFPSLKTFSRPRQYIVLSVLAFYFILVLVGFIKNNQ